MTPERLEVPSAKRIILHPRTHLISDKKRIAISMQDKIEVLATDSILFLKSESNYTHLQCQDGSHWIVCQTLKHFNESLCAPQFLRVHKSYLVQIRFLKTYYPKSQKIILTNDIEIPVSRAKRNLVMGYLKSLVI